ncbi:uncharacterized protein BO97DRAFT_432984 [Aspergillus homomorphus CBS 101889]|uniref:D-isomer specific 2-hydroxyacid dehydrogenase NAD-binding domain-containing protein n=1 Tax=Aspergillus homomorphus (strain CBS 101889) TaxID=1450537 RepID=A0A395I541_ASPHC|nr:hypothetical protein BO97DRAFT_432984 [Aspergillus homomorphus CBS 101889]RAL14308.1 hypothetical protein BO97DRAFT_432984 [Aspergillus homomorphus CBS 101889]
MSTTKPKVLHIGDNIKYNHELYARFASQFELIQPSAAERSRAEFKRALQEGRWGNFHAIFRPFWNTGGEMSNWDEELISLLPASVQIIASAGAGYDWANVECFARYAPPRTPSTTAHTHSPLTARNPSTQTIGIIGLGAIGLTIARKARAAFPGIRVVYHDLVRKGPELEGSIDATYAATLEGVLRAVDCAVLATSFAGCTLIDAAALGKFRRGAGGFLSAVGLDVHASELVVHLRLAASRRVMMLSHDAGGRWIHMWRFEKLAMENLLGFFGEGRAVTPVNAHLVKMDKGGGGKLKSLL